MLDITFHINDYKTTFEFLSNIMALSNMSEEQGEMSILFHLPSPNLYLKYIEDSQMIKIYDDHGIDDIKDLDYDNSHDNEAQALLTLNGHLSSISESDDSEGKHIINLKFLVKDEEKVLSILQNHATVRVQSS